MALDDNRHNHNHNRISPRVIGAVAGMWGGMRPSPSHLAIDQILVTNGVDPRKYPGKKQERVLHSLQDSGAETAARLIRGYIDRLKVEGYFLSEEAATIASFNELQSAFTSIDAELKNSGELIWDSESLQPDSFVNIECGDQIWTYDKDEEEIGKGGYGIVYHGWDKDDHSVAIKKVPLNQDGDVRQLYREVNNTQELREKAPNSVEHVLIPIAEVQDSESLYIVMPYAKEGSLKKKLSKEGKLGTEESLQILEQITKGLNELHSIGVLHRDIKTDNVLYQDGKWKLSDFGLSRFIENDTASYTMAFKGSTGYTAPEVINQEQKTVRSDLYSVGVIAYEMLAGKKPFTGDKDEVRNATLTMQPPSLPEEIPGNVRRIVSRLLSKNPAERYFDPPNLLEAIEHARSKTDQPFSRFAQALAKREDEKESAHIQHALQRQEFEKLADRKTQAISDLDEKIDRAVELAQKDEPSTSVSFDKNLNLWHINAKGYGLAFIIWDEIIEETEDRSYELLHSGEIYFIPEPQEPESAHTINGLVRKNRIPDSNLVCRVNPVSRLPEWFLFSINGTSKEHGGIGRAHGFSRADFESHWKKANRPGPKIFNYTNNTELLTPDGIMDLLIHAVEGRYLEAIRTGM